MVAGAATSLLSSRLSLAPQNTLGFLLVLLQLVDSSLHNLRNVPKVLVSGCEVMVRFAQPPHKATKLGKLACITSSKVSDKLTKRSGFASGQMEPSIL